MVYKTAFTRTNTIFPVYRKMLLSGDLDTANGQDRRDFVAPHEGKERFKFLKQQKG